MVKGIVLVERGVAQHKPNMLLRSGIVGTPASMYDNHEHGKEFRVSGRY